MFVPVFEPVRVSVRAPLPPKAIDPVFVKLMLLAAVPCEESSVAVNPLASPMVKRRSVLVAAAVLYCRVPPPKTISAAEPPEVPLPMLLTVSMFATEVDSEDYSIRDDNQR